MKYKVGLISLGCAKNRVDAEMLLSKIREHGYEIVSNSNDADAIIINTCGFIQASKEESIEEIFNTVALKNSPESNLKAVIVTGCLAERYKQQILSEIPEVDAVVGIGANSKIVEVLNEALMGKKVEMYESKYNMPLDGSRLQTTPKHYAYLKIADGCDNRCTYCAIPLIRGTFRSRKMENVVEEAKSLADSGVKELLVIAQDTTRYGEDLYGKLMLVPLLKELCKIDGIKWIRLLYCYPDRITDELLDLMSKEDKILNYIDLPLQHCSKGILSKMNRRGNSKSLKKLIDKIREKVKNVVLRTTFICGFPGESEENFEELLKFVKEVKFERMGCFSYSREEDTPAYNFPDQIDEDEKSKRCDIIMREQMDIMDDYCANQVGKVITVIVDEYDESTGKWFGRSDADSPDVDGGVIFDAKLKEVEVGSFVDVLITGYENCDLIGKLV